MKIYKHYLIKYTCISTYTIYTNHYSRSTLNTVTVREKTKQRACRQELTRQNIGKLKFFTYLTQYASILVFT